MDDGQLIVLNCTAEEQQIKALGSWFKFAAGSKKVMRSDLARWIGDQKKDQGLICLPERFNDDEYFNSEEGKTEFLRFKKIGLDGYIAALTRRANNGLISLKNDLDKVNVKIDILRAITPGEAEAIKLLNKYQTQEQDESAKNADELRELLKNTQIGS